MIVTHRWTANIAGQPGTVMRATFWSQKSQVAYLREVVRAYSSTPTIREQARKIVFDIYNVPQKAQALQALAIGNWVKENIRYLAESEETFYTPIQTLRVRAADCDDHATLICALLESIGIPSRLKALAWKTSAGFGFQHIYAEAAVRIGDRQRWLALDSTLEEPIGFNPMIKALREHGTVKAFML